MKHCISLDDFTPAELHQILELALQIKQQPQRFTNLLDARWLLMLFQKTSTRTRMSFEIGMGKLGGHTVVLDWDTSNFSISPLEYEARYASTQVDLMMARLKKHSDIRGLADNSLVPVINGCDEKFHPCQALADLLTVYEQQGTLHDQSVAFVGIHNNVANSLATGCAALGVHLYLVTPEVNPAAYDDAMMERVTATGHVERTTDLQRAAREARFVYTDTWVDMEFFHDPSYAEEKQRRIDALLPYQLNAENLAGSQAYIMHDMPVHPGYEISEEMVHSPRSLIFQQAENRQYAQQALMLFLLGAVPA